MGASGSLAVAEKEAALSKAKVDEVVSDYLEFLETTSALIDENIEDLDHEIAVVVTQLRVSDAVKALPAIEQSRLLEDVEKHANLHKHAVRRVFSVLSDGYDTFEDMSYAITQPDEDGEGDDDEDGDDDDDEEEEGDEDEEVVEEEELDDEDDEEDEDYNTAAAEEELAAEMDDEDDEDEDDEDVDGDDEDDEDALDYEDYEEIVTDEEVLYSARIACTHYLQEYANEMRSVGLPADLCAARVALLRRMLYRAAESMVTEAVDYFVGTYRNSALEDIDNLLCLGMTSGSVSSDDPDDVRSALKNIITVNAVSRQALEDLPFTQRGAIDRAQDEIAEAVLDVIRKIQLQNIDRPRVLEMLMDLDIDDFGDEEDDEEVDMDDFEDQDGDDDDDDDDDDDEEEEKIVVRKGKAAPQPRGKAAVEPKVAPAASPAPKKAGRPSNAAAVAAATAANTETNASASKRKAVAEPAPAAAAAPKRGRK